MALRDEEHVHHPVSKGGAGADNRVLQLDGGGTGGEAGGGRWEWGGGWGAHCHMKLFISCDTFVVVQVAPTESDPERRFEPRPFTTLHQW